MQRQHPPVWTPQRRFMGNLLPSLFCLPFGVFGIVRLLKFGLSDSLGIAAVIAFPVVGWWALNLLGLYQNAAMRALLGRRLNSDRPPDTVEKVFVGIARASFRSAMDPHEDVAFLILHDDRLEIYGETLHAEIERGKIDAVLKKPNPHSLFFLGGWIVVRGRFPDKEWRIESRERGTLFGNFLLRSRLKTRLEAWWKKQSPEPEPGAIATRSDAKP